MFLNYWNGIDRAARTIDLDWFGRADVMCLENWDVTTARLCAETVCKSRFQTGARRCVHMNIDALPRDVKKGPKIVDTVCMIGVIVCEKNAVDVADPGVDQLFANVWWRVDENTRVAQSSKALH